MSLSRAPFPVVLGPELTGGGRSIAREARAMLARAWWSIGVTFGVLAALLFGGAATVLWPAGWAFIIMTSVGSVIVTRDLARRDPALLAERVKPPVHPGQPLWDRLLMGAVVSVFLAWFVLMGIDARAHDFTASPIFQALGAGCIAACFVASAAVYRANTFLAPVVRIQSERGHHVVTTGPYAIVRHPLYAAGMLFFIGTPLILGSPLGLFGALVLAGGFVVRTVLEDALLQRSLPGYAEYARRVRYRLVPYVW